MVILELKDKIEKARIDFGDKAKDMIANFYEIENWDGNKGCCPFHREDTSSFIWNPKNNSFHCFGCGKDFDIINFYQQSQGMGFIDAVNMLLEQTGQQKINKFEYKENSYFNNYRYPKEENNDNREKVEKYLNKRSISVDTLDFCDIKQDVKGNIVFEHRDENGKLLCTKYRPSQKVRKGQAKMWWQEKSSTCPILYGANWIDITKPLVIVEGHVDVLAVIESGLYNVVSIPHGAEDKNWIEFNWEWLENFDKIILWFDDDKVGQKALKEVVSRLGEHRCFVVDYPSDIKQQISDKFKGIEDKIDANNVLFACGKEQVRFLIDNAKEIPLSNVIDVFDADDFDVKDEEHIPTSFNSVDSMLFGHYMNTISIWTGRPGHGKSSVIIQSCIIEPLDLGYSVFVFSGELTSGMLKNWITTPIAGNRHIMEFDNGDNKPKSYTVTKEAKDAIASHYKGRVFTHDEELETTPSDILNRMEYMYKKRGVKVFIIDNLMCVDFSEYEDEYKAQKKFVMDIIAFQRKYGVQVHLVAHPKKNDFFQELTEYDIFGSSNIPNLAHRIYAIRRVSEQEKQDPDNPLSRYSAVFRILKDRITGIYRKNVGINYDFSSKRLYSEKDDVDRAYNWEKSIEIQYKEDKKMTIKAYKKDTQYSEVLGEVG